MNQTFTNLERLPLFIGAGVIKTEESIRLYAQSEHLAVQVLGSFGEPEWGGTDPSNTKRRFYWDEETRAAYNAFGLNNCGRKAASEFLPRSIQALHDAGQLAVGSVAAMAYEDPTKVLPGLAEWMLECGADGVEINGSCPNQELHSLLCESAPKTLEVATAVRQRIGDSYLQLKVSALEETTVNMFRGDARLPVDAVALINNCRRLSPNDPLRGVPYIEVNDGYAGQSGPIIGDLARANLLMWTAPQEGAGAPYEAWSIGGIEDGVEAWRRIHDLGAEMAGGAQHFFRAVDPLQEIEKWADEYRNAEMT